MTERIRGWSPDDGTPPPAPIAEQSSDDPDDQRAAQYVIDRKHRLVLEDVDRRFTYHAPKGDQPERYVAIRREARDLAFLIVYLCPESRERSLALTHLEQAVMWANAAIARNE